MDFLPNLNMKIPQPIIVFGIMNSGTSFIMNLLHLGGAWIGETKRGNWRNQLGFFENKLLDKAIYEARKSGKDISITVMNEIYRQGFRGGHWAVKQFQKEVRLWKENFEPFWVFFDPFWVFIKRDFECVLRSRYRDKLNDGPIDNEKIKKVKSLFNDYKILCEDIKSSTSKYFTITPDKIVKGNYTELKALYKELNLVYYSDMVNLIIQRDMWQFKDGKKYEVC